MRGSPAKLSHDQIVAIYLSNDANKNLAADYGVSTGLISWIKRGKRWTHVTDAVVTNASLISATFGVYQ